MSASTLGHVTNLGVSDGFSLDGEQVLISGLLESELLSASLMADRHEDVYEAAVRAAAIFLAAARPAEEAG